MREGLALRSFSYSSVTSILKHGLDQRPLATGSTRATPCTATSAVRTTTARRTMLTHSTSRTQVPATAPMASGLLEQRERPDYHELSFEDRLGLLVDAELLQRQNRRLERILKAAKLRSGAVVEDLDFSTTRGLDKTTLHSLVNSPWVSNHHR